MGVSLTGKALFRRRDMGCLAQILQNALATLHQLLRILLPCLRNLKANLGKTRLPFPRLRGKISPSHDGLEFRRQPDTHGPPTMPRACLHEIHVDGIHIRTLLAVHFDADEMVVHHLGNTLIFKRLMGHHMAPVAGRIPNGEKDHFSF